MEEWGQHSQHSVKFKVSALKKSFLSISDCSNLKGDIVYVVSFQHQGSLDYSWFILKILVCGQVT